MSITTQNETYNFIKSFQVGDKVRITLKNKMKLYSCSYTPDIIFGTVSTIYEDYDTEYFGFVKRKWAVMNIILDLECELDRSNTPIGKIKPIIQVMSFPNYAISNIEKLHR
jgi:hypothetical protein